MEGPASVSAADSASNFVNDSAPGSVKSPAEALVVKSSADSATGPNAVSALDTATASIDTSEDSASDSDTSPNAVSASDSATDSVATSARVDEFGVALSRLEAHLRVMSDPGTAFAWLPLIHRGRLLLVEEEEEG